MTAKLFRDRLVSGAWRVECEVDDGAVEAAVFSGHNAFQRALVFAGEYYGRFEQVRLPPLVGTA